MFPRRQSLEFLRRFDTDRDGEMDKEEYFDFVFGSMLESARGFMKAADTSGDGKLSKEELATCFANVRLINTCISVLALVSEGSVY